MKDSISIEFLTKAIIYKKKRNKYSKMTLIGIKISFQEQSQILIKKKSFYLRHPRRSGLMI